MNPQFRQYLLRDAALYRWSDLNNSPALPPTRPGVYAWFFKQIPEAVPTSGCIVRDSFTLLYVGISPKNPRSRQTLRSRIRYHFRGNAEGSTLRLTLGCLLKDELGTVLRKVGSGKRRTFADAEATLTEWMAQNARVSWVETDDPVALEEHLIKTLVLPLNLDQNDHSAFHARLSEIRRKARERALLLPLVKVR